MRFAYAVPALALALTLGASSAAPAWPAVASTSLKLNEFLAGPARDWDGDGVLSTRDDEWVEITNTGGTTLDLSSFYLTDGDSIPRYGFSGIITPGERRLVFGGDAYAWEKATSHPAFGLSLGNTGDQVILWQVVGADSMVVDRYTYLAHEAGPDRAVGRLPDGAGAWALLDGLDPYTGALSPPATGCSPTPGSVNTCTATEARRVSWGGLKTIYR
jgi:hypothetical protein